MYKRILVPIGRAPNPLLQQAIDFAAEHRAKLRLLHVIDYPLISDEDGGFVGTPDEAIDRLRHHGARVLAEAWAMARAADVDADSVLHDAGEHTLADLIARSALDWDADLILVLPDASRVAMPERA